MLDVHDVKSSPQFLLHTYVCVVVGVLLVADTELLEPTGDPTEDGPKVVDRQGKEDLGGQGPDLLDHVVIGR